MGTKLARIAQLSKENPDMVFTSIGHLINKELLMECHKTMDGKKAVGIDGVTKEDYGRNLEENLDKLVGRLKQKSQLHDRLQDEGISEEGWRSRKTTGKQGR